MKLVKSYLVRWGSKMQTQQDTLQNTKSNFPLKASDPGYHHGWRLVTFYPCDSFNYYEKPQGQNITFSGRKTYFEDICETPQHCSVSKGITSFSWGPLTKGNGPRVKVYLDITYFLMELRLHRHDLSIYYCPSVWIWFIPNRHLVVILLGNESSCL